MEEDVHVLVHTVRGHQCGLITEFRDAWAEGDGDQLITLLVYNSTSLKYSGCTKYRYNAMFIMAKI